jgi:hypothetical protein
MVLALIKVPVVGKVFDSGFTMEDLLKKRATQKVALFKIHSHIQRCIEIVKVFTGLGGWLYG